MAAPAQFRVPGMPSPAIMVIASAVLLLTTGQLASAIECYECTITPPSPMSNEPKRLCVNFDYSAQYVVDCPFSTMCMKKAFDLKLRDGQSVHGVLRGCASQKHNSQVYKDNGWHEKTKIIEAYEEGCRMDDDKGARSLPTEYCYCRSHLCNSAPSSTKGGELSYHTDAMAVIFVFNAMKYVRSMR